MRLCLVYLLKGKVEKYHQKLVKVIGPRFGENYMIENPLPSHITLKSPFDLRDIKVLEKILNEFSKSHSAFNVEIGGFGNFNRFVSFLKIKKSKKLISIQKDLLKTIVKINRVRLHDFDRNWKPHATIVYGNTKHSFDKIWTHLNKLKKTKFNIPFNNITILKKIKGRWKVYEEFKLR